MTTLNHPHIQCAADKAAATRFRFEIERGDGFEEVEVFAFCHKSAQDVFDDYRRGRISASEEEKAAELFEF